MTEKPKLLDQVRQALHLENYAYRTEESCIYWIKKWTFFQQNNPLNSEKIKIQ